MTPEQGGCEREGVSDHHEAWDNHCVRETEKRGKGGEILPTEQNGLQCLEVSELPIDAEGFQAWRNEFMPMMNLRQHPRGLRGHFLPLLPQCERLCSGETKVHLHLTAADGASRSTPRSANGEVFPPPELTSSA